jgi:hypothetical protein
MTREEAEAAVAARKAEHPGDAWLARDRGDTWEVVRLPGLGRKPSKETVEAKPKPPQADDPRSALERNIGGPYGAG